jgi:type I restriction enzyme S subunit
VTMDSVCRNTSVTRLSEVAHVIMGQSPGSETYRDEADGLPFFQGKADFGELHPTPRKYCVSPIKIAEVNDVLVSVRAPVGPTNIANARCCLGRGLAAVRAKENKIMPKFLYYVLTAAGDFLLSRATGTTFLAISRADIDAIQFVLPALTEQQRIVDILDRAAAIQRLRRAAEEKAREIIPALFVDMFGDPATNPKGWPIATIAEVCDARLGKMLDKARQTGLPLKPYLRNTNVRWGRFDLTDVLQMGLTEKDCAEFLLVPGDVLVCEGGEVGRAAVWTGEIGECYFQKALHRLRPDPTRCAPIYLQQIFSMMAASGQLSEYTSHSTISHLTGVKLAGIRVPLPPIDHQNLFGEYVERLYSFEFQRNNANRKVVQLAATLSNRFLR